MTHQDDLLRREAQRARQVKRLGPNPRCRICGWTMYAALIKDRSGIICYDCRNAERGRPIWEDHHPRGHAYPDFTVRVRGNMHRAFHDPVYGEQAWLDYLARESRAALRRKIRGLR
jgi:hypothetical protein